MLRRCLLAISVMVVVSSCAAGGGAFRSPESGVTDGFHGAAVGETLWFGLPVVPVRGTRAVKITDARLLDGGAFLADVRFFHFSFTSTGRRHFGLLEDKYLHQYGILPDGPLIGSTFEPGTPTSYAAFSARLVHAGRRLIHKVRLSYVRADGSRGSQIIEANWDIGTAR